MLRTIETTITVVLTLAALPFLFMAVVWAGLNWPTIIEDTLQFVMQWICILYALPVLAYRIILRMLKSTVDALNRRVESDPIFRARCQRLFGVQS